MKLIDALKELEIKGYTNASDEYSYHGRKLKNWHKYALNDNKDWIIEYNENKSASIKETSKFPSNQFFVWKRK